MHVPEQIRPEIGEVRKPEHAVHPLFVNRWSPRVMSGEPLTDAELMTLFEAARWAPSSYNEQPWRLLYARRETPEWERFFNLLVPANRGWCFNAAVLILVVARKTFTRNGKPNRVHSFDCGSCWMSIALQAELLGLVAHGMAGFDRDRAREELNVPEEFDVEAMIALGRHGTGEGYSEQVIEGDKKVSDRRPVGETAFEGGFPAP
jgi:nitroreductase